MAKDFNLLDQLVDSQFVDFQLIDPKLVDHLMVDPQLVEKVIWVMNNNLLY